MGVPGSGQIGSAVAQTETITQLKEDGMSHFVRCTLEGLRRACAKTLNDAKLANIEQEEKESPGKFLDFEKPFTDSLNLIPKVKREE